MQVYDMLDQHTLKEHNITHAPVCIICEQAVTVDCLAEVMHTRTNKKVLNPDTVICVDCFQDANS